MSKYIFITGGVVSSLGKGIMAASIGRLLIESGYKVHMQKFDPYLNIDPGTMNPTEHGEVFVTSDGLEADLDLGHYERIVGIDTTKNSNVTAGKIYLEVLNGERDGKYLGKTIQVVPTITNHVKEKFCAAESENKDLDVIITEIGGTVGDIESLPFLESIRQLSLERHDDVLVVHCALMPYLETSHEHKTKPIQHSVKMLNSYGINQGIVVVRSNEQIGDDLKNKIAMFTNVTPSRVFVSHNVKNVYEIPSVLEEQKLAQTIIEVLKLKKGYKPLKDWNVFLSKFNNLKLTKKVAIVGKYVSLPDAYLSVIESLTFAGIENQIKVSIELVDAEKLTDDNAKKTLSGYDAIIVPGGFGQRAIEGKICAIKYARTNKVPFLGICLGMQLSVIEFARNVLSIKDADSTEFNPKTKSPLVKIMDDPKYISRMGGTLRLGNWRADFIKGSLVSKIYGSDFALERHRHRYEINNDYVSKFDKTDLVFSGTNKDANLVEYLELKNHPYFVGTQAHPELTSKANKVNPLFLHLIKATLK